MPKEPDKKAFDEKPLARLLEAAFVLQEHAQAPPKLVVSLPEAAPVAAALTDDESASRPEPETAPALVDLRPESPSGAALETAAPQAPAAIATTESVPVDTREAAAEFPPSVPNQTTGTIPLAPSVAAGDALEPALPPAQPNVKSDYRVVLAKIVEAHDQLRAQNLALDQALPAIAERVREITQAGGVAIGFLDGKAVRYRVVSGAMTPAAGAEIPLEQALCAACLRAGQAVRASDVNNEFLIDLEECRRRGVQAMIAVPVLHQDAVVAALELYYASPQAFTEQDTHACQLMAGLIVESLQREEELTRKKSLASERAIMLEALERLKPNLAALASGAGGKAREATSPAAPPSVSAYLCSKCGHRLVAGEQFCGKCGTQLADEMPNPSIATVPAWQPADRVPGNEEMRQSPFSFSGEDLPERQLADSIEEEMPELFASPESRLARMERDQTNPAAELRGFSLEEFRAGNPGTEETLAGQAGMKPKFPIEAMPALNVSEKPVPAAADAAVSGAEEKKQEAGSPEPASPVGSQAAEPAPETALIKPAWSSASAARDFLEGLAGTQRKGAFLRFWSARRGDVYLAIAVILVAVVIRWGLWSGHSVGATGTPPTADANHRKTTPDAGLSTWDRMLISLGLAEAPPAPESKGNPDTQVWVDLHTALYYCSSDDLYGKTPKGKYTSQHDAQLDQYEPAYRKPCE